LIVPALVLLFVRMYPDLQGCVDRYGPASTETTAGVGGTCHKVSIQVGAVVVAFYAVVLLTGIVGLVLGVVDGRARRCFAYGRWVCVVLVGLTGPWALLNYALAYGFGRLLPAPRPHAPRPDEMVMQLGWQEALQLFQRLAGGQSPPAVLAPDFLTSGSVFMDAPLLYSRFYGTTVTYGHNSIYTYGSPVVVTGALIGNFIGNTVARTRARNLARPQWREFSEVRVVVTPTTTWCQVRGRWLAFEHAAVMEYTLTGPNCVMTFADTEPLRLSGPSAWCHAVMFAYARYGAQHWQDAPMLDPLRRAVHAVAETNRPTAAAGGTQ
jgi:hypothetical protein